MRSHLRRVSREESGFTLIEMLTVMAILGVIFAVMAMVLSMSIRDSNSAEAAIDGIGGRVAKASGTL